ncbi:MAG TPA: ABC transporter permease [Lachnospiraceae bacterium]|nr:ABC transporter permease [Lachnospiraceae bacterium]
MLGKLAFRNVLRSAKDYMVYFLTMMLVTAIMFAFHSLMFSEEVQQLFEMSMLMAVLIGLATFFVVLIVAWLIHYMVRFILEKRSREFGIYLLIGMKKKEISRLYMRESLLLGIAAFAGGLALGMLLQQILMAILYSMIMMEYHIRLDWNMGCLLTTGACYGGCYLLALFHCQRKFKKMNIHALMNSQRQNEKIIESHEETKRWLLPLSVLTLLALGMLLFFYKSWDTLTVLLFLAGLIAAIYLFYSGVAAWIICYIRNKGKGIFRGQNLFLLRQFSSKIKTLRFTLGTLTSLFVLALLGCAIAMMFNDFQNQILINKWPFDVQIFSSNTEDDFKEELDILHRETEVKEAYTYLIYQNGKNTVNTWLYTHLRMFGDDYRNSDGKPNADKIAATENWVYYKYDTYMALSDYNHLREMAGFTTVTLEDTQYILHLKERVWNETGDFTDEIQITVPADIPLTPAGVYTESLSQDGHNGADYLIIVSDNTAQRLTPYYRMLVANLKEKAPDNLQKELDRLTSENSYADFGGHQESEAMAAGSDSIMVFVYKNMVRDNLIPEAKFLLSSIIFSLVYIGLIFVCVALTVLSVQQLSDSARYRFRYRVLHQIGLGQREISGVILRQLAGFYLCPILFAAVISGTIAVYVGWKFNFYTGTRTAAIGYFGISFLLFLAVYVVYFVVTYVGFCRNVLNGGQC